MADVRPRIASEIRARRLALSLSQRELASRARLPTETVSRLERGVGNPTLSTIESVAAGLGCDLGALFTTEPPQTNPRDPIVTLVRALSGADRRRAFAVLRALVRAR